MKVLIVLGLLALVGCGSTATLEELEEQAMITGDWSAVEKRERINARRAARKGPKCPSGTIGVCHSNIGNDRCSCVQQDSVRDLIVQGLSDY